jgi:hypothetical protein
MSGENKRNYILPTDQRHTIKALKKENRILRAELKRLSRIIRTNTIEGMSKRSLPKESSSAFVYAEKEANLLSSSSYIKYLVSKLTGGSLFSYSKKAMGYFRKFKLVSTIMRTASSILAILGTGAFFIFLSGTLIFIIPLIVAFCAAIYLLGTLSRARAFREIEKRIENRRIFVFFPEGERHFRENSSLQYTIKAILSDTQSNNFVIIVSPFVFSSIGVGGKGFYSVARFENTGICMLRRHSFFLLRKRILGPAESRTTYVY